MNTTTNFIDSDAELHEIRQQTEETLRIITKHGFVLDTTKWLTIKRYAEKYGISQQVVTNWIARGIIPADAVQVLPELNDLRLVRDQIYK